LKRPFVYLVRKRALGDVLWIEPLIRQLALENKKVIVFTKYRDLFLNYPLANVVFRENLGFFEKVFWKMESYLGTKFRFINLEGVYEQRPKMHLLHAYQEKAGQPKTFEYPRIYFNPIEKETRLVNDDKYAVFHLDSASSRNFRKVYGVDWSFIARMLTQQGFKVYQIGKQGQPIDGVTFLPTTIREMILLIKDSKLFIGLDSGPSHIAASLKIPSIIFFGAVNPLFRHFLDKLNGVIMQQFCEYAGCYHEKANSVDGVICKWVGDEGIPKCSLHSNTEVITAINKLTGNVVEEKNIP
jgi:hypothetical protein